MLLYKEITEIELVVNNYEWESVDQDIFLITLNFCVRTLNESMSLGVLIIMVYLRLPVIFKKVLILG